MRIVVASLRRQGFTRFELPLVAIALISLHAFPTVRAADAPPDSLALVRGYADAMIEKGRDTYGSVSSPLFAAALDRKTFRVFEGRPPSLPNIREHDRTFTGANPMHDLNLYQVLYALTQVTGEERYAREADAALKWFFEHCQSPKGLMAWGEHQGWSFLADSPSMPDAPHEFYHPWVLAPRTTLLAPQAMHRFALGLWEHQIGDQASGGFSRHSYNVWDLAKKGSQVGAEFPRHGGFYIAIWAADYQRTSDPTMLRAIEMLLDSFLKRRNPVSGAIPQSSSQLDLFPPMSGLSLAIDLWDAAGRVPESLATRLRDAARQMDEVFLKVPHEPGVGGQGFVKSAYPQSLQPGHPRADETGMNKAGRWLPYAEVWATGYGVPTNARCALQVALRHQQTGDERLKALVLACANTYLTSDPDLNATIRGGRKQAYFPAALAEAIWLESTAYRITGQTQYLDRADHFARVAISLFFTPDSPLPRVGSLPQMDWYEAITGADTLAMALLDLWNTHHRPQEPLNLIWCER